MQFPKTLRTPVAAAFLSAVFPGLGQAAAGKPSRGAIAAVPTFAFIAALLIAAIFDRDAVFNGTFDTTWLTSLLLVDLIFLVYHLWAIFDAYLLAKQMSQPRRRTMTASTTKWSAVFGVAIIVSGTVFVHGWFATVDMGWQHAVSDIGGDCPAWGCDSQPTGPIQMSADPGDQQVGDTPSPDPSGSGGGATAAPTATLDPNATFDPNSLPSMPTSDQAKNWRADGQFNVLLAGVDSGVGGGRNSGLRPDTMIVLHVDIKSGKAAMIGIPRNTTCVPLPQPIASHYSQAANGCPGNTFPYMLNWLANDAGWNHPSWYPYDQSLNAYTRAMLGTEAAISTLTGLPIDGFVVINLTGLINVIDALGGIDINVPKMVADYPCGPKGTWQAQFRVCDLNPGGSAASRVHNGYSVPLEDPAEVRHMIADAAQSNGLQTITWSKDANIAFKILPGQQHMDGDWALAYARTRIYSSDYDRMIRQQSVLKAMRNTFSPCAVLPRIPSLVNSLGGALWTDLPLTDASQWAGMAKYIVGGSVKSITLDPGTLKVASNYITPSSWNVAKNIVAHSLDTVPAADGGSGGSGGGGFSC